MSILNNTNLLNNLLEQANNLPDAGGVDLPELTSPATEDEVFSGKELIDQEGNVVTGTFTIDSELNTQDNLIAQLSTILDTKAAATGVELPTLTNPASASEILTGYEAIDENGEIITGILEQSSGSAKNTVTVHVTPYSNTVYYWDADKNQQSISNSASPITIEALSGVVYYVRVSATSCTGNYVSEVITDFGHQLYIFLEDGGTMRCYTSASSD